MPNSGYFDVPFALSGDVTPVPDGVQPDGSVSFEQGYGPDYEQDPVTNPTTALEIERTKMNQIFFYITSAIQQYQQNGVPPFITTAMNNGTPYSYSKGNLAQTGGVAYQSIVNANTDTPPSAKWEVFDVSLNLLKAQNLADLANLATALGNLSFASDGVSYIKIPNPFNTAKPIIFQWGSASIASGSVVNVTYPIAFPNAVLWAGAVDGATALNTSGAIAYGVWKTSLSSLNIIRAGSGVAFPYWFAIGN